MPVFTHFTFVAKWCKGSSNKEGKEKDVEGKDETQVKTGGEAEGPFIIFSAKFTLLNLLMSTLGNVVYGFSMAHIGGLDTGSEALYLPFGGAFL